MILTSQREIYVVRHPTCNVAIASCVTRGMGDPDKQTSFSGVLNNA